MTKPTVSCLATAFLGVSLWAAGWPGGAAQAIAQPQVGSRPIGDPARGQYLVERVAMCGECHSGRDPEGNIIPSERFMGGPLPPAPMWSRDWAARAPRNAGLPGFTDEMARQLLMEGAIGRDGRQLRAPMPRFRMTLQDANDVIAYMRTVP